MKIVFAYSAPKHRECLDKVGAEHLLISYFAVGNKPTEDFKRVVAKKEAKNERVIKRRALKND